MAWGPMLIGQQAFVVVDERRAVFLVQASYPVRQRRLLPASPLVSGCVCGGRRNWDMKDAEIQKLGAAIMVKGVGPRRFSTSEWLFARLLL